MADETKTVRAEDEKMEQQAAQPKATKQPAK